MLCCCASLLPASSLPLVVLSCPASLPVPAGLAGWPPALRFARPWPSLPLAVLTCVFYLVRLRLLSRSFSVFCLVFFVWFRGILCLLVCVPLAIWPFSWGCAVGRPVSVPLSSVCSAAVAGSASALFVRSSAGSPSGAVVLVVFPGSASSLAFAFARSAARLSGCPVRVRGGGASPWSVSVPFACGPVVRPVALSVVPGPGFAGRLAAFVGFACGGAL